MDSRVGIRGSNPSLRGASHGPGVAAQSLGGRNTKRYAFLGEAKPLTPGTPTAAIRSFPSDSDTHEGRLVTLGAQPTEAPSKVHCTSDSSALPGVLKGRPRGSLSCRCSCGNCEFGIISCPRI